MTISYDLAMFLGASVSHKCKGKVWDMLWRNWSECCGYMLNQNHTLIQDPGFQLGMALQSSSGQWNVIRNGIRFLQAKV